MSRQLFFGSSQVLYLLSNNFFLFLSLICGIVSKLVRGGCGQNPGHLNEVIYGIYSPTNYCSIKTV